VFDLRRERVSSSLLQTPGRRPFAFRGLVWLRLAGSRVVLRATALWIPFLVRQKHEMCANARMSSHYGAANWLIPVHCRHESSN
jgi:hypothetical protein